MKQEIFKHLLDHLETADEEMETWNWIEIRGKIRIQKYDAELECAKNWFELGKIRKPTAEPLTRVSEPSCFEAASRNFFLMKGLQ